MSFRRSDLGVSFEPGSEPIAGEVRLADGSTTTFRGYVQLIAAVEQAHRLSTGDPATPARVGEPGEG